MLGGFGFFQAVEYEQLGKQAVLYKMWFKWVN